MKQITTDGHSLYLNGPDGDAYFQNIHNHQNKNLELYKIVKIISSVGPFTIVDVGANIGLVSITLAKKFPELKIIAIEPNSKIFSFLKENISYNKCLNIHPVNVGIGESDHTANLYQPDFFSAGSHIVNEKYLGDPPVDCLRTIHIKRLDDIIKDPSHVKMIKIDTEGFEKEVIQGCKQIINRDKNIVFYIEFNSWCLLAHKNEHPARFLEYLHGMFTHIYTFNNNKFIRLKKARPDSFGFLHNNIVCNGCVDDLICLNKDITDLYPEGIKAVAESKVSIKQRLPFILLKKVVKKVRPFLIL